MSFQPRQITAESVLNFRRRPQAAALAPLNADSLLPVLVVLHQETSTPGRVGNALRALGHKLDIRRPRFGDCLPETLDGHAGAVIFGGPMSANDSDDFIRREIDWIAVPLREQRPFLGICLGAQMLAMQLGARVALHPQGRSQIGYYSIRPTPAGLKVCPDWPDHVYHWHHEGFELPADAELLGARARHHHFADRAVHDVIERAWLKQFLDRWLARAPRSVMSEAAE
jgi:GMP synthase (glutamine-hydrolysing)